MSVKKKIIPMDYGLRTAVPASPASLLGEPSGPKIRGMAKTPSVIGANIRAVARRVGITQAHVAKALRKPTPQVNEWFTTVGGGGTVAMALGIARVLSCSLDEIVKDLDPVYDAQRAAAATQPVSAGVTSPVLRAGMLDGPLEDLLAMPVDERIRRIACGLAMLEEPELASVYAEIRRIISTAASGHEPTSKEGTSP